MNLYEGNGMKFSEREGLVKKALQLNKIDRDLRNRLWNVVVEYLNKLNALKKGRILRGIWTEELKSPLDSFPEEPKKPKGKRWEIGHGFGITGKRFENEEVAKYEDELLPKYIEKLKNRQMQIKLVFQYGNWFKVYDILEFLLKQKELSRYKGTIILKINKVLKEEKSGYRFVNKQFAKLTDNEEIQEVKIALAHPMDSVKTHIKDALSFLSDRRNPNYRNSMKESISAVEALCKYIVNDPDTTLGQALNYIEQKTKIPLHADLKIAYKKLYKYTSDAEGIRHEIKDKPTIDDHDARFFLIICSAFVNYLTELARKTNIQI